MSLNEELCALAQPWPIMRLTSEVCDGLWAGLCWTHTDCSKTNSFSLASPLFPDFLMLLVSGVNEPLLCAADEEMVAAVDMKGKANEFTIQFEGLSQPKNCPVSGPVQSLSK